MHDDNTSNQSGNQTSNTSSSERLELTRTSAVGFYYVDQHGQSWATSESVGYVRTCQACGKVTNRGYDDGMFPEEGRFTCGCNVVVVDNTPKAYPGMMLPPGSEPVSEPPLAFRYWAPSNIFDARDRYVQARNGMRIRVRLYEGENRGH